MRSALVGLLVVAMAGSGHVHAQPGRSPSRDGPLASFSQILGRPTDKSVVISVLCATDLEAFVEYGSTPGAFGSQTSARSVKAGEPVEFELSGLSPNAAYSYRIQTKAKGAAAFTPREEATFRTQRKRGETFTFGVQGDSHPERLGKMYDPDLYVQTIMHVAKGAPDFYFLMGDDFSIERLIERKTLSQAAVDAIYAHQRGFLGLAGKSTPLMLVNGNHEQAAKYLLDGTPNNFAVFAGKARTTFYPLPEPGGIYTGNVEPVEHIGLLRDYYAWEWGDALFVVIDPYWHSEVPVDNEAGVRAPQQDPGRDPQPGRGNNRDTKRRGRENDDGGGNAADGGTHAVGQPGAPQGKGNRDLWQITLGNTQYIWLRKTLQESKAPFKFVFSHHVMGTGRGGVEVARQYEWGGQDRRGVDRFVQMRPTWEQPIHNLMRDSGVTIFFQGHDHLYARQELDGVIYQSCPNPADPTFTAFNAQSYRSGDIFPNSGYLRVTVAPGETKVDYVRSFRPQDEGPGKVNGSIAHTYTVKPRDPKPIQTKPPLATSPPSPLSPASPSPARSPEPKR